MADAADSRSRSLKIKSENGGCDRDQHGNLVGVQPDTFILRRDVIPGSERRWRRNSAAHIQRCGAPHKPRRLKTYDDICAHGTVLVSSENRLQRDSEADRRIVSTIFEFAAERFAVRRGLLTRWVFLSSGPLSFIDENVGRTGCRLPYTFGYGARRMLSEFRHI
jgi:hypothetical protein